ncbi:conserved hypothetical protein [metagenome]|uniref:Peptidase MA-like domain-containing protein n=1 Tax=metagenome TaxID=256318 RepID=A0A2P2BW41_9ZZZZ
MLVRGDEQPTTEPGTSVGRPDRGQRAELAKLALRRLEQAVSHGGAAPAGPASSTVVANARALRVSDFHLDYLQEDPGAMTGGSEQWVASVDVSWRFASDPGPARAPVSVTFERQGTATTIAAVGGQARRTPLWLATPVSVVRRPGVLVLAADGGSATRRYAALAVRARAQVGEVLGRSPGHVVVEVPSSETELAAALSAQPGEYDEVAAVTTTVDGSLTPDSPQHIFVNPATYEPLRRPGSQVVMTHEVVHLATRAATADLPLWLVEGFADYVALSPVRLPLSATTAELRAQLRRDGLPDALPLDSDFGAGGEHVGAAYEAAWLACVTLADLGGRQRLVDYYEAVDDGGSRAAETREVFGVSHAFFIRSWRARLRDLAG